MKNIQKQQVNRIKMLCNFTTKKLYNYLIEFLSQNGYDKIGYNKGNYIIAEGDPQYPVCLIAHMDTVFTEPAKEKEFFYDEQKQVLWSPDGAGFDDRAGISIIIDLINAGFRPSIIFTNYEETGGLGARQLVKDYTVCPFVDCRCLIELDRAHAQDMIFYNCDNKAFIKYIGKYGFKKEYGTFTDISIIAPSWGIGAVNLSVGYVSEHSYMERLYFKWLNKTFSKVRHILINSKDMPYFEYVENKDFTFSINKCICCDKKLNEREGKSFKAIEPYQICETCYKTYYPEGSFEF